MPDSRDPAVPRLDGRGLVLSAGGLALLVHAIIEAPERGWGSPTSLLALAAAASFFALFGFIFLITRYFEFIEGFGPLETGLRILPVATFVALASVLGARMAVRFGTKVVVTAGLLSLSVAYAWTSTATGSAGCASIVGQMILLGAGMGLTSTPATQAIMGVVPAAKAGIGSAVNDATREIGGTLGVAVITQTARDGFVDGLSTGCLVASGVALLGALFVARYLPAHPVAEEPAIVEPRAQVLAA